MNIFPFFDENPFLVEWLTHVGPVFLPPNCLNTNSAALSQLLRLAVPSRNTIGEELFTKLGGGNWECKEAQEIRV